MFRNILIGIIAIAGLAVAYVLISPAFQVKVANENSPTVEIGDQDIVVKTEQPSKQVSLVSADFVKSAHDVKGRAVVIDAGSLRVLRFEDFETINGPDLRIWLATDTSGEDYIDLGEIKATKGNVNYDLPPGVDLNKYKDVLVWCRAFHVLFSYAELK